VREASKRLGLRPSTSSSSVPLPATWHPLLRCWPQTACLFLHSECNAPRQHNPLQQTTVLRKGPGLVLDAPAGRCHCRATVTQGPRAWRLLCAFHGLVGGASTVCGDVWPLCRGGAGGMVLHKGEIAEMRTGEGKTLVAVLAAHLNALSGKGVHVGDGERLPGTERRRVGGAGAPLPGAQGRPPSNVSAAHGLLTPRRPGFRDPRCPGVLAS